MADFDLILVGGGLANGLIADRLATERPELRILIIEAGDRLGGDHTWSFHASDVSGEQDRWLQTIGQSSWTAQEVRFPTYTRELSTGYRTIVSADLHKRLINRQCLSLMLSRRVETVSAASVTLEGGQELTARCIIDGRGLAGMPGLSLGYQKFFGLEFEMAEPHGLQNPIIMDTTIDQHDGYRFIYCLPYSATTMLIEDTYYSDGPEMDRDVLSRRVHDYARAKGWTISKIIREESSILPVVLDGMLEMVWPEQDRQPRSGMRSGMFHQTTGYSLPFAARTADSLAKLDLLTTEIAATHLRELATRSWDSQNFFRLLNRFLFIAAEGDQRRAIFERFYKLPGGLIERFYAADLHASDKFRIVFGRPPVAIDRALGAIPPSAAASRRITDLFSAS